MLRRLPQFLVLPYTTLFRSVSWLSASLNVAVRVGVEVFSRAPSAGDTSAGVEGATFEVLFVTARPVAVAAALPVESARSRTIEIGRASRRERVWRSGGGRGVAREKGLWLEAG